MERFRYHEGYEPIDAIDQLHHKDHQTSQNKLDASLPAFSSETKGAIKRRVLAQHGKLCSELSGRADLPLEAAHKDHNKKSPNYDRPENGILVTVDEHLVDHIIHEGENGLNSYQNKWAIEQIAKRVEMVAGHEYLTEVLKEVSK